MTEMADVSKLADKVLHNPLLVRMLTDRVYELMIEDLRNQRDRSSYSRRSF